jgi:hypothetical protein
LKVRIGNSLDRGCPGAQWSDGVANTNHPHKTPKYSDGVLCGSFMLIARNGCDAAGLVSPSADRETNDPSWRAFKSRRGLGKSRDDHWKHVPISGRHEGQVKLSVIFKELRTCLIPFP